MKKRIHRHLGEAVVLFVWLLFVSCDQPRKVVESASPSVKVFKVHGIVQKIKSEEKVVVVDHEAIPDYMGAMIMPFKVRDAAELVGLQAGDEIRFDYKVEELQSWIEKIQVTGKKGEVKIDGVEERGAKSGELLPLNSQLPDYSFFDESGASVKLSDYRGGPVVLTFVFTRCPVPEYCPAMMRNFAAAAKILASDDDAPELWNLLTISFDVDFDSPSLMKTWGKLFGFESGNSWHLLSAKKGSDTIEKIASDVGLKFGGNKGSYQHNLRTVVLDAEGKIRHIFTDETWSVNDLLREMKKASLPLK